MKMQTVTLEGVAVRLEPIRKSHCQGLCEAVSDGELWKLFVTLVPAVPEIEAFIDAAISDYEQGSGLTFVTVDKKTGKVVGSTRYMKADLANKRVEIGYTFIANSFQRTVVNTEAKYLMLRHAFETLGMNRVEFLTDFLNKRSQTAIQRLGAKQEGIIRNHMIMPNGRIRDSILYSIIKNEWPGVKEHLLSKLSFPC